MAIIVNLDVMLAKRKMSVTELSERVGITMANISIIFLLQIFYLFGRM
jgi:DNA-binding Xre family transcriptional regulator